jgi:enoyl-CoA hydratase/carnithine racemase
VSYQYARYEKKGRLAYVTIDRPEAMNALHPPATNELDAIWDDFAADPEVWIAILTGAGDRAFSAGNDLKYTAQHGRPATPFRHGFGGITWRYDLWKPVIAAVNGYALGGGFEMALACDIIVAADSAQFGLPEPKRGLLAGAGGVHRLPRQIPLKLAMGMILTGRHITAEEAKSYGLVNEVVPRDKLMETAERWAAEILECAPISVRASKQSVYEGLDLPLESAVERLYYELALMRGSEDTKEGPRAFAEKRKPVWQNK